MIKFFLALLIFSVTAKADESEMLGLIEQKINASIEEKAQLSVEKNELEKQIVDLKQKIKERKLMISLRLKAQSRLKKFQWGELLLNNNLNDLNRDLKILNNLNSYDYELFKEYRSGLLLLSSSEKNLADTETQIQNNIQNLNHQVDEFKKLEDVRIDLLQKEKSNSLLLNKGHLSRPLESKPLHEFGTLRDQFRQYYLINYGELYSPPKLTAVKSVGPGVVIFRDLMGRWRETLVVQHSDNYYSVYAGVHSTNLKVGDNVIDQQILGSTSEKEFYFELRHFANPINPKKWYKELK